jgi:hypothetical protein
MPIFQMLDLNKSQMDFVRSLSACLSFGFSEIVPGDNGWIKCLILLCTRAAQSLGSAVTFVFFEVLYRQDPTTHTFDVSRQLRPSASSMANVRSLRSLFKAIALLAAIFLLVLGFGFIQYSDRVLQTQPGNTGNLNPPSESPYSLALVSLNDMKAYGHQRNRLACTLQVRPPRLQLVDQVKQMKLCSRKHHHIFMRS